MLEADIVQNDEMGHFLGTIVVAKNPNNTQCYDIIDGQQRATTLFMLRYALNSKKEDPRRNLNYFLDDNDNFRLNVSDNNKEIFKKILLQFDNKQLNVSLENELQTKGHKNLYEVGKDIFSRIEKIDSQRASNLLLVLDKMILMWLEEKNSGRAIRLFQTVNDRGVPLLLLDKLKSLLILYSNKYCNGKFDDVINERFGKIFKLSIQIQEHPVSSSIGDRDFSKNVETRIFNYHSLGQEGIGHYSYGAEESFKKIKQVLKGKKDLETWLNKYSSDLLDFFKSFLTILNLARENTEAFKLLYVLKLNPYFYSSLVRLQMNNVLDDEILRLFGQAEIFFYGSGSTNDSSAYNLYKYANNKDNFIQELKNSCKKCSKGGQNIEQVLSQIYIDNYNWGKYFHYLFLTYRHPNLNIDMCKKLLKDKDDKEATTYSLQIEHIIPQNASENGSLEDYGFKDVENFNYLKNTFGNLLSLESWLNSANRDYGLAQRKENYKKSKVFYNQIFANSEDFMNFNKNKIEEENKKFVLWAKNFFQDFLD